MMRIIYPYLFFASLSLLNWQVYFARNLKKIESKLLLVPLQPYHKPEYQVLSKCIWLWFEWMQSDAFLCDKHTIFSFPLFWVIWYISFLLTCSFNDFLEIFILTDPNNKLIRTVHWLVHWLEQFWFEIVHNFGRLSKKWDIMFKL